MKQAVDSGEIGTLCFMEANFSNERALEFTPDTWRCYKDKAFGGPISQL
jgi:predicted dehydrogenase